MKKRKKSLLLIVFVMIICCFLVYIPSFATQKEIDKVQENIKELEEERDNVQQQLQELEEEKIDINERLQQINDSLAKVAGELTSIQIRIEKKEKDIFENQQELEFAKQEEILQYENMKTRIRFFYEKEKMSFIEVLLSARSFADFINIAEYVENIYQYDREMLTQYRLVKEDIVFREIELEEDHKNLLLILDEKEEKQQEVNILLNEVWNLAKKTNEQIENTEEEIAAYEAKIEEQRAYEQELERQKAIEDAKRMEEIRKQEEEDWGDPIVSDSESDLALLAAIIECEAGGESYEGKLAVGSVVLNRVRSSYFPNSILEVLYQHRQFTPVTTGRFAEVLRRGANAECVRAAKENLSGVTTVDCLYFRTNNGLVDGYVLGNHVFY